MHRNWDVGSLGLHAATQTLEPPPVPPVDPPLPPVPPLPPAPLPPVPCALTHENPCWVNPGRHSKSHSEPLQVAFEFAGGVLQGVQP